MYFDKCNSIQELNEVRDSIITEVNNEYSRKLKQIKALTNKQKVGLIMKAEEYKDNDEISMAYIIRNEKGNPNEIIFHADGTVTI